MKFNKSCQVKKLNLSFSTSIQNQHHFSWAQQFIQFHLRGIPEVVWKKHPCDRTSGTHLAVKEPVKPLKLIDNEPGEICSKGAHTETAEKDTRVSQTYRLKSFAAGQQDQLIPFLPGH